MVRRVSCNNKGFTLIELLIAMFIIALSMLAMLSAMLTAIRTNVETDVRNTAIRLTNQTAETMYSLQWAEVNHVVRMDPELILGDHSRTAGNLDQDAKGFPVLSQSIRNFRQDYQIRWSVVDLTDKNKRITITVSYTRNGQEFSNVSVIYRDMGKAAGTGGGGWT